MRVNHMIDRTTLPPPVRGGKEMLSKPALAEIAALNGPRPSVSTLKLLSAWAVIVGAIALATYVNAAWATILAIIVVATRQNVLGLLVHEQAHLLGYRASSGISWSTSSRPIQCWF